MKQGTKSLILASLTFGSLWGISEATLGFFLHLASRVSFIPTLAGFVMFPLAFFFMRAAFKASNSIYAIPLTASITASIKLASLIMPRVTLIFVINPVISILAESLAVLLFFKLNQYLENKLLIPKALVISMAWRVVFLLSILVLPIPKGILQKGYSLLLRFLILDAAVNGLLIGSLLKIRISWKKSGLLRNSLMKPVTSGALVAIALVFTAFA